MLSWRSLPLWRTFSTFGQTKERIMQKTTAPDTLDDLEALDARLRAKGITLEGALAIVIKQSLGIEAHRVDTAETPEA